MSFSKLLRDRLGLSQRQMADLLGISSFQYALYETGRNEKREDGWKTLKLEQDSRDFDPTAGVIYDEVILRSELHALEKLHRKLSKELHTIRIRLNAARPRQNKMMEHFQRAVNLFRTTQFLRTKGYLKDRPTLLEIDYRKQAKSYGLNSPLLQENHMLEIEMLQHALQHKEAVETRVSDRMIEIKSTLEILNTKGKKKK